MPLQPYIYPYPDGGINETLPAHLIAENELCDAINMYYDAGDRFVSRPGTEWIASFTGPIWGMGSIPSAHYAFAIVDGTNLKGRATIFGNLNFNTIKSGLLAGERYFTPMNNVLYIGCFNGQASTDNISWDITTTTAVTWSGPAVPFSYLCTWNARMWAASAVLRTRLYFSKVGDATDFTTAGISGAGFIDIGYSDSDEIMGLAVHNEQLFIFKRQSIWHIVTANPNTDNTLWRVEKLTSNYGCTNHEGLVVAGNDVLFPAMSGYIGLNTALYQGDFKAAQVSKNIKYQATGSACYVPTTDQILYCVSWDSRSLAFGDVAGSLWTLDRTQNRNRWNKMQIRNSLGTKVQPWMVAYGYPATRTYGNYFGATFNGGTLDTYNAIVVFDTNSLTFDLLQYPTTKQGADANYDYIGGPSGPVPIRKYFKTKDQTFGSALYDKKTRMVAFTSRKPDRAATVLGDDVTIRTTFDGNTNKNQELVITDNGDNLSNSLRTAVAHIEGADGRVFRSIQHEVTQNVGGYQFEYGEMQMDYEVLTGVPTATDKVSS